MPDYTWPPEKQRRVMGRGLSRLDGPVKASGRAKYSSDLKQPGMLYAALLTCPHGHARVKSVDIAAAKAVAGVTAVRVISPPGTEIQWAGTEVAAVAASSMQVAEDAVRRINVEYEVLPHLVLEEDLTRATGRTKPSAQILVGDPDKAFQEAEVTSEGYYGIQALTHCPLEPHGQVIAWKGDAVEFWPSTQSLSAIGSELAMGIGVPAANVHVYQQHMGGGFGSKFSAERWGVECARLSQESGGQPVKLFLDRRTDLEIAGSRASGFARIRLGARKDGTVTAWQAESWGTSGISGGGVPANMQPYVFTNIPNRRVNHTGVITNMVNIRAWRAPNNPQAAVLTCCAVDDLADTLKMDPLEVFDRNFQYTARAEVYRAQLKRAAEMIDWKKLWHPRSQLTSGAVKRGLGIGVGTWGGLGHASQCRATLHPDGSVQVELATQDIGTGTRTVIAMVAAESLGLEPSQIQVNIGDNKYPPSGTSGGSTTVGGVSASSRKATLNALEKLLGVVAPALGAPLDQLEAVAGRIQVRGTPAKGLSWKEACQKMGVKPISEIGENNPKLPGGLISQGVGGVQIADVSVDVETGVVKMNRLAVVQDCGLIVNPKTAESQVFGACIMNICAALYEERIMDALTGRMLNGGFDYYKLAGIGDIGEILVHLDISPENDKRGVIGLGEPPVCPGIAAIANAVANAIGVRVPIVPMTPARVLTALERSKA